MYGRRAQCESEGADSERAAQVRTPSEEPTAMEANQRHGAGPVP